MGKASASTQQQLVDWHDIQQVVATHARGIDRRDAGILKSVYHQDGTVSYGIFEGDAHEFCDILANSSVGNPVTLHRPSNLWIRMKGDHAVSEAYVIAYMHTPGEGGAQDTQSLIGGRYLDRFSKRAGVWKLDHRTYVLDWNTNWPGTGTAASGYTPMTPTLGAERDADPGGKILTAFHAADTGAKSMTTQDNLENRADVALSRIDIQNLIFAQARATDRGDLKALQAVWHPGAKVDVGMFVGTADDYCPMIVDATKDFKAMAHTINNCWVDVRGDKAVAESYLIAFTRVAHDDGIKDEFTGGRYLDSFERRDGVWKFTDRTFVMDWSTSQPSTDASNEGMMAQLKTRGGRYPNDPVFDHWGG